MPNKPFKYHFSHWKNSLTSTNLKQCMVCHGTDKNTGPHSSCDCPILKKLGFKLEKVQSNASHAQVQEPPPPLVPPTPAQASSSLSLVTSSTAPPAAMTAFAEEDTSSEYSYEGKSDGLMFNGSNNSNTSDHYLGVHHSLSQVSFESPRVTSSSWSQSTPSSSSKDPQGVRTVSLPKKLMALLSNPPANSISPFDKSVRNSRSSLVVADTGATDHMIPDRSAFISYRLVSGRRVQMGNNSFAPILGVGSAIISLNGKKVLIRDCLHVPELRQPLYSLRAHQRQQGCGFLGMKDLGVFVIFPTFILEVDTTTDCHLIYEPCGPTVPLIQLDYVQPKKLQKVQSATATTTPKVPVLIEPDDNDDLIAPEDEPTYASHWPKKPPTPLPSLPSQPLVPPPAYSVSLKDLDRDELIQRLYSHEHPPVSTKLSSSSPLRCMSENEILEELHHSGLSPPPVRPCDTPNASETKSHWTSEELHKIMGCRRFRNYQHLIATSKDGTFFNSGEFPLSLGTYTTIPKSPHGKPIDRTRSKYLDIVHVDIAFGDCASVGGFKFALIFVDRATRYNWCFGLKSLQHEDIKAAFLAFCAEAGALARQFRCDCDEKLFGSNVRSFLHLHNSSIVASPAGRQSANGLVESHWKIMVHMARAYLTDKQMPRNFWYYAIKHSARMMNMIPGKYRGKLASPFMLAHGVRPDQRTWIPLFSLCYFHHEKDSESSRSKNQAHTLDGIILGRSPTSNAILVYNPRNQKYYEPDSYKIDPHRLPSSVYPSIVYDGGLFVSLHRDEVPIISEPYPPGTRVEVRDEGTKRTGTVMDIPMDPAISPQYLIQFDDGTTTSVPSSTMPSIIPRPPEEPTTSSHLLPPFLQLDSKITYEKDGTYHKGYLSQTPDGVYKFVYKSHVNKKREDWSVPLPDLPSTWHQLCTDGILLPGHTASTFLRTASSSTFDPVASFVSAINLVRDCPRSLLTALSESYPDREVWLQSYREEKSGLQSQNTYEKLTLAQYRALREKGAPRAIPSMCVLTINTATEIVPLEIKIAPCAKVFD